MTQDPVTSAAGVPPAGARGILVPGSTVAGYVIEEQIGAGGMAVVYRARDDVLGRLVAVKVLSPALAADQEFRTRFLRESRAVAAVDEPHIVPVYGAGDAAGVLYIATRFVAGGDLSRLQRAAGGPLPPAQAADLIAQVASALDAAHAIGLVHRDVKPGNILVESAPGRPEHAYLSDFGLSKATSGQTSLTATDRFMGTPDFCAPEQVTGGTVDGRTDQYSLACVGFTLLAGVVPFNRGDTLARLFAHVNAPVPALTSIRPELPTAVDGILARGMAKNPAERYGSCAAFAAALRGALGVGAGPSPSQDIVPPQAREPVMVPGSLEYQQTVTAGGWQHPSIPPGSPGQVLPPPNQGQHSLRKNTSLIVSGSVAAAVVLVAGIIVGVALSGQHGKTSGLSRPTTSAKGPTPSAAGTGPAAGEVDHTGTATLVGSLPVPGGDLANGAFFSADGKYIAAANGKSGVYIFSTETMKLIKTVSVGTNDIAAPVSFSPDDSTLYAIDVTVGKMYDLDIATGKQSHIYSLAAGSGVSWTFGSRMVGAVNSSGTDAEYDLATGKLYAQVRNPGSASVKAVYTDAAGRYILISDNNGEAYLVDTPSKKVITRFSYHLGSGNAYPQISLDGNTVYLPGGATAAAKLWDRTTKSYITPTDARWPTLDSGVTLSTDGRFALTSPTSVSEVVDIWNIATRAHAITLTVPGGTNEEVLSVGPGGSELLSTGSLDISKGTFSKLNIWAVPG